MADQNGFELRFEALLRRHASAAAGRPTPEAVNQAVAERHRARPSLRRRFELPRTRIWLLAGVALVTTAGAASLLAGGPESPKPPPLQSASQSTQSSARPGQSQPASATALPAAVPIPDSPSALTAGRYYIDIELFYMQQCCSPVSGGVARMSFDLPDGWTGRGRSISNGDPESAGSLTLTPWTMGISYRMPCQGRDLDHTNDPPLLRTVGGIAETFRNYGLGQVPAIRLSEPVLFAGQPSLYLELLMPPTIDFDSCDDGSYTLWLDWANVPMSIRGPGEVDRLWIADVGAHPSDRLDPYTGSRTRDPARVADGTVPAALGGPMLLVASWVPRVSLEADLQRMDATAREFQAIVDSIEFEMLESAGD